MRIRVAHYIVPIIFFAGCERITPVNVVVGFDTFALGVENVYTHCGEKHHNFQVDSSAKTITLTYVTTPTSLRCIQKEYEKAARSMESM